MTSEVPVELTAGIVSDVIALAASAGSLRAIELHPVPVSGDFPATLLVTHHFASKYRSYMAQILAQRTDLRMEREENGEMIQPQATNEELRNRMDDAGRASALPKATNRRQQ